MHLYDTEHVSIFRTSSKFTAVIISPAVCGAMDCRRYYPTGLPVFRPSFVKRKQSVYIAFLLLIGNVELNPGPANNTRRFISRKQKVPRNSNKINFGCMNVRSAVRKAALIHDVIRDHKLDLVFLTETWISSDAPDAIKMDVALKGYRVMHAHRGSSDDRRGGGIAVIYRDSMKLSLADVGKYDEFESMSVKVMSSNLSHIVVCIYRPPGNVSESFCDQFSDLLDQLLICGKQYIICGDLNCPGDGETQIDRHLQHVLTSYNQLQLVVGPTHDVGHTLDLLILPEVQRNWVSYVDIQSLCFSDHSLVRCRFGAALHRSPVVSFSYRRLKQINLHSIPSWHCWITPIRSNSTGQFSRWIYVDVYI